MNHRCSIQNEERYVVKYRSNLSRWLSSIPRDTKHQKISFTWCFSELSSKTLHEDSESFCIWNFSLLSMPSTRFAWKESNVSRNCNALGDLMQLTSFASKEFRVSRNYKALGDLDAIDTVCMGGIRCFEEPQSIRWSRCDWHHSHCKIGSVYVSGWIGSAYMFIDENVVSNHGSGLVIIRGIKMRKGFVWCGVFKGTSFPV